MPLALAALPATFTLPGYDISLLSACHLRLSLAWVWDFTLWYTCGHASHLPCSEGCMVLACWGRPPTYYLY